MGYRVGVDVGGTFTDIICVTPDGEVVLEKAPTTPDDQSMGVMDAMSRLADRVEGPGPLPGANRQDRGGSSCSYRIPGERSAR